MQAVSSSKYMSSASVQLNLVLKCLIAVEFIELCSYLPLLNGIQCIIAGIFLLCLSGGVFGLVSFILSQYRLNASYFNRLVHFVSHWQTAPVRSFIETSIWLNSVLSIFLLTSSYVQSSSLGSLIAMGGIQILDTGVSRYAQLIQEKLNQQLLFKLFLLSLELAYLTNAVATSLFPSSVSSLSSSSSGSEHETLGCLQDLSTSFLILCLVMISLVVASELLLLWKVTRHAGRVLQSRLIHARYNWTYVLLRSMTEATILFSVIVFSFTQTKHVLITIQLGTAAAIVLILLSEYLFDNGASRPAGGKVMPMTSRHRRFRREQPSESEHWVKILPLLFLCGSLGIRVMNIVLYHRLEILSAMTSSAAATLLFIGSTKVLMSYSKTCTLGQLLNDRIVEFPQNAIKVHPIRTCTEIGCGLGVMYGSNATYHNFVLAIVLGTMSSATVVIAGTLFHSSMYAPRQQDTSIVYTFLLLFVMIGSVAFNTIYTYLNHVGISAVLATSVGVAFSCVCEPITDWTPALAVARILQDRFFNSKTNWQLFPMRSAVELACWVGVFIGTFIISTNLFLACLFGTLSGALVTLGGEVLRHKVTMFSESDASQASSSSSSSSSPSLSFVVLAGYGSIGMLYIIYHYIASIEVAFCLASLSGVVFISASELLLIWKPTRAAGLVLQDRILHALDNWKIEPTRSFVEVWCWLGSTYGTFAIYDDLILALQLGTFVAIVVTLTGDYCRNTLMPRHREAQEIRKRSKLLPFILLLGYVGAGAFTWIFDNMRSIEVALLLFTVASVSLITVADLLMLYRPTRIAGIILQQRFLKYRDNWNKHPVRSFIEVGVWLGVTYGSYVMYRNITQAVQFGTISGMVVTLMGEGLKRVYRPYRAQLLENDHELKQQPKILPFPVMFVLGIFGAMAFDIIYSYLDRIELAFVVATLTGSAFLVIGDLFACWRPTRAIGLILQQRLVGMRSNIRHFPIRTAIEFSVWSIALFSSTTLVSAIKTGLTTAILICVVTERCVQYVQSFEQTLRLKLKTQRRHSTQSQATLMEMPYEVLFEVARYLPAQDLLTVRTACHRVNDMLKAEASRYWTQREEERKIRLLLFEFVNVLRPWIMAKNVLESSRSLRWIHFNATWIREHRLPVLKRSNDADRVVLEKGHAGYVVFRHIPDKESLGILLADPTTLSVPFDLYEKIQQDPLIYTASQSVSDVPILTIWHMMSVIVVLVSILLLVIMFKCGIVTVLHYGTSSLRLAV